MDEKVAIAILLWSVVGFCVGGAGFIIGRLSAGDRWYKCPKCGSVLPDPNKEEPGKGEPEDYTTEELRSMSDTQLIMLGMVEESGGAGGPICGGDIGDEMLRRIQEGKGKES